VAVPKFKDMKAREWDVVTSVLTFGRVREDMKFGLPELILGDTNPETGKSENNLLTRIADDPIETARLIYLMVRDQLEAQKVTAEDFYASLDGDALKTGLWAVLESVVGFCQSATRPALEKMLRAAHRVEILHETRLRTDLQSPTLDAEIEKAIQQSLNPPAPAVTRSGGDVGNLPESSGSTLPTESLPVATA
jgi:hypothetical protein